MLRRAAWCIAFFVVCAPLRAEATDPPGTPKPAVGAPGDKPGRNDPFGTQGEKADENKSQAEKVAQVHKPRIVAIRVEGNDRVPDEHVLDHIYVHVGDDLDDEKVKLSRIRLLQLGPFSMVQAEVQRGEGEHEGEVTLLFTVEERNNVFITDLYYGSTATTKFYGGAGAAVADMFDTGLSIAAGGLYGSGGRYGARLSIYDPDVNIWDRSFVAGIQGLSQSNVENACGSVDCFQKKLDLHYLRNGGEASVGMRAGEYGRLLFSYRYELIDVRFDDGATPNASLYIRPGRSQISAAVLDYDRDARDDTFLPTKGSRFIAQLTMSSAAIGSSYEYTKLLLQEEQWIPQGGGRAWRLDAAVGLVQGNAPFFDRFYAADWSYFAIGRATSRLLELNLSPDPRYDAVLALVGSEYDFPLWKTKKFFLHRGYLALCSRLVYTAGYPGGSRTKLSKIPFSWDVAVRVDTPAGVFSVSLGYLADLIF